MYLFILHPGQLAPPGVKLPLGSLPPGGEDTLGYLAPTLGSLPSGGEAVSGQLAPPGVKIPWPGQLVPPPPENLTELNAERFYFFKIKILKVETREN